MNCNELEGRTRQKNTSFCEMWRSKSIEFIVAFHQCGDKSWKFHRGFKISTSKDEEKNCRC